MAKKLRKPFALLVRARDWYGKYERPISSLSLIGGFVFNAVALTRVDEFKENFWIAIHLLVVAACIVLINRQETEEGEAFLHGANPSKIHFWLINVMQFMFGGLLSTFLVFYFRSAVLSVAWPFMLLLLVVFIANESFKRHFARLYFQVSFFFLCIFLFAIFFVPVLVHEISPSIFVVSGIASLVVMYVFIMILKATSHTHGKENPLGKKRGILFFSITSIFIGMNVLYFYNFIPPLPLALHDTCVYHTIVRTSDGNYEVTKETTTFKDKVKEYFGVYPTFHTTSGKPVYVFSAIFSPAEFNLTVVHEWQVYDALDKKWNTVGQTSLPIQGGREGGYRTYSARSGLPAGKWRVNIQTPSGQVLGRLVFNISLQDTAPVLETELKK